MFFLLWLREAAKKVLFLVVRPLRPLPPPRLSGHKELFFPQPQIKKMPNKKFLFPQWSGPNLPPKSQVPPSQWSDDTGYKKGRIPGTTLVDADPYMCFSLIWFQQSKKIIIQEMWPDMKLVHGKPRHSQSQVRNERKKSPSALVIMYFMHSCTNMHFI